MRQTANAGFLRACLILPVSFLERRIVYMYRKWRRAPIACLLAVCAIWNCARCIAFDSNSCRNGRQTFLRNRHPCESLAPLSISGPWKLGGISSILRRILFGRIKNAKVRLNADWFFVSRCQNYLLDWSRANNVDKRWQHARLFNARKAIVESSKQAVLIEILKPSASNLDNYDPSIIIRSSRRDNLRRAMVSPSPSPSPFCSVLPSIRKHRARKSLVKMADLCNRSFIEHASWIILNPRVSPPRWVRSTWAIERRGECWNRNKLENFFGEERRESRLRI